MTSLTLLLAMLMFQEPAQKCRLSGTLTDSVSGMPLNRVQVLLESLDSSQAAPAIANTNAQGYFSMVDLDSGQYRVKGVRNGYLDTYYGARRGDGKGTTVTLESGNEIKDLQIKLLPYAVIAGAVRDPDGEPVAGARVSVSRLIYRDGQRDLEFSDEIATDDLGQYRAPNLKPGRYYVEVQPAEVFDSFHPPVDHSPKVSQPVEILLGAFYPGVRARADARTVEVTAGARATGVDITLPRGRLHSVSGRMPSGVTCNVQLNRPDSAFGERIAWLDNVKGDFEIRGVPPGAYSLRAWVNDNSSHDRLTDIPVTIDNADVTGLKLSFESQPEVSVQIAVEGDVARRLTHLEITFGKQSRVRMEGALSLESIHLNPGHYMVGVETADPDNNLVIQSIRIEQTDILRDGFTLTPGANVRLEIVLAPDGGQIAGTALDKSDNPVSGATVVAVPEPGLRIRPDRFYQAATDQNGRYQLKNVAPGDYKIFVWDDIEPGAWFDPDFLREIESRGEPVKLSAKEHETAKLHIQ